MLLLMRRVEMTAVMQEISNNPSSSLHTHTYLHIHCYKWCITGTCSSGRCENSCSLCGAFSAVVHKSASGKSSKMVVDVNRKKIFIIVPLTSVELLPLVSSGFPTSTSNYFFLFPKQKEIFVGTWFLDLYHARELVLTECYRSPLWYSYGQSWHHSFTFIKCPWISNSSNYFQRYIEKILVIS